jgi:hypothetical protein
MTATETVNQQSLLDRVHSFLMPGGSETARNVRSVRTTQCGEMRMSPESRWIPFTAEELIDSTGSNFRWEARLDPGRLLGASVVDAYERGRGALTVKFGGVRVKKIAGPDVDKAELQRYLSSFVICPAMLLNHLTLECAPVASSTFRLCDLRDETGATVDFELAEGGAPTAVHAMRPRLIGSRTILTPWSGHVSEFREFEGMRIASRLEVAWKLPEGDFRYFREEITSFQIRH